MALDAPQDGFRVISRRSFFAFVTAALVPPARSFTLRAVAAAHLPHTRTIRSRDARVAAHFASGGLFEIREYDGGSQRLLLFDSDAQRWTSPPSERRVPRAISLYRPA